MQYIYMYIYINKYTLLLAAISCKLPLEVIRQKTTGVRESESHRARGRDQGLSITDLSSDLCEA